MVQIKAHLALLAFDMSIIGSFTAKQPDHGLIQKMFRRMCWRKLFLVVIVKNIVHTYYVVMP